ncbi:MAG: tetratricopeptide repeat protein, partial [Chloroflexi bacterium]|nr:tetratricopeptide repeat protein [Chloroflexota bacterium]
YAAAPLLGVVRGVGTGVKPEESTDLAIAESKEALRLSPDYPDAYLILGEAYMYLGEDDKALQAFESALDLKCSSEVEVHAETEKSQVEVGLSHKPQPDEARKHLERAVVYRDQRKYGRAEAELNKALKCAPDWPWVYRNVCEVAVQAPGSISGTSE